MVSAMSCQHDLGIVILTHGTDGVYVPLVDSLVDQGADPASIVIVHNSTSPGGLRLTPPAAGVQVIHNGRNLGYAGGMNAGMREQLGRRSTSVLLLTHEVRLRDGALDALLDAAGRSPQFGVLGPALRYPGSDRIFSYGGRRARDGSVEHVMAPPAAGGIAVCDWVDGAAMLVRADVLEKVGVMDDRLFMYFEETDFCLRVQRAGWQVGVVLDAVAEQAPGGGRRPGAFTYLMSRNGAEYARRSSGAYGVASAIRRTALDSGALLGSLIPNRATAQQRAASRATLAAMWLGILDFARRRWGPPPAGLDGLGDAVGTGEL